jgi:two-component system, NtrC family, response regulator GlrR
MSWGLQTEAGKVLPQGEKPRRTHCGRAPLTGSYRFMPHTNLLLLSLNAREEWLRSVRSILEETASFGFRVTESALADLPPREGGRSAGGADGRLQPDLVLLCLAQLALDAAESACQALREKFKDIPLVLVVESADPRQLCHLLKHGAADFLLSPLRPDDVLPRLLRLAEHAREADSTVRSLKDRLGLKQFIGESKVLMQEVAKIPKVAQCDATVLITGETGTGKEMAARAIHYLSPRSKQPFIPVNCGAIPVELMENELFGHEAGAFTGATSSMPGMIHDTHGGTLFLDEIDSLTPAAQVKVLRFLQDKEYRPLGSRKVCKADVRVVAASNVNFDEAVRLGKFRSDLYYRLSVIPICLPPLRRRKEDVPPLARHLLAKYSPETAAATKRFSPAALEKLIRYDWPGNVRELENVIQRAAILSTRESITSEDICLPASALDIDESSFKSLKARAVAEFEVSYIRQLLATSGGNITKAASSAKKNRRAFWQLMRKHQIPASRETSI